MRSLQIIHTECRPADRDPIVSPTRPWCIEEDDPEFDSLRDLHQVGFFHVAEYVCQDDEPRRKAKILLIRDLRMDL